MSRYLVDRIERTPNVEVLLHTEVREVVGDRSLEALVVEDNRTGERRTIPARDLFVFIGAEPHAGWLRDQVALDENGFVLTGQDALRHASPTGRRLPFSLETSRHGVFAAGTCGAGRSSGSPPPSARARWRSARSTSTSRRSAARRAATRSVAADQEKLRSRPQSFGIGALSGQKVTGAPCSRPATLYGTVRCATSLGDVHIHATSDGW
jgi:thioredoxin reductase